MNGRAGVVVPLVVVLLVVFSGCSGLAPGGQSTDRSWEYRFVVENDAHGPRNVTVTVDPTGAGPVVNETRRVEPDDQWVVTELSGSELGDGYSVVVSTGRAGRVLTDEAAVKSAGATVYHLGTGTVAVCGGNVTCYE